MLTEELCAAETVAVLVGLGRTLALGDRGEEGVRLGVLEPVTGIATMKP